jgi:hypothetical protein
LNDEKKTIIIIIIFVFSDFISCSSYTTINNNNSPNNGNNSNKKAEEERKHKVYAHNPYNGVVYNDIILATGVFSSKELWKLSKGSADAGNYDFQCRIQLTSILFTF